MSATMLQDELRKQIRSLGPWFHDLDIHGVRTAPDHPLGNFLSNLWDRVEAAFPEDMSGKTVLDIGCNAGFYSLRLHARGAHVVGIEHDPHYLSQARFAAEQTGAEIDYRLMDVYEVDTFDQKFDYVLFMGVFYHLRYPLFALDKVARLPRERLVFQSMVRGPGDSPDVAPDYPITEKEIFEDPRFPAMYFIEHRYAGDPTNWWVPNEAGLEAMLRSSGLHIECKQGEGIYFCVPGDA